MGKLRTHNMNLNNETRYQSGLQTILLADRTGLEPATSAVTGRHSNQLNYRSVPLILGTAKIGDLAFRQKKFLNLFELIVPAGIGVFSTISQGHNQYFLNTFVPENSYF
jgi:hypothetical protein